MRKYFWHILFLGLGAAGIAFIWLKHPRPNHAATVTPSLPASAEEERKQVRHTAETAANNVHEKEFAPELLHESWRPFSVSALEIRRRHERLLLLPLPSYAFKLRGFLSPDGLPAYWIFEFPEERDLDFESYLVKLGVPQDGIFNAKVVQENYMPSRGDAVRNAAGVIGLIYYSTIPRKNVSGDFLDYFALGGQTLDYYSYRFKNPRIGDAYAVITYFPTTRVVMVSEEKLEHL